MKPLVSQNKTNGFQLCDCDPKALKILLVKEVLYSSSSANGNGCCVRWTQSYVL